MRSILIVEDNEVIIKGLTYLLEKENFHVIICKNVNETMNVIGKQEIHLIVLDIALPDGNGFELCEYIKKYTDIPVIFLTAKDEEQDVVKGLDLGAEDYIIKPFRNRELLSRINNVLKRFNKEDNKKGKNLGTRIAGFILCAIIGGLIGLICSIIPTIFNIWVNYIIIPILVLILMILLLYKTSSNN